MAGSTLDVDRLPGDARWFPADLDVASANWSFLRIGVEALERSVFLDDRLQAGTSPARVLDHRTVEAAVAAAGGDGPAAPAWLFHTSYCGSTLFARALHLPPFQVALKEPLVLRRLADAHRHGVPAGNCLATAVALLSRRWFAGGGVVIKPTHVALPLAAEFMRASAGSRALVLTSSLEDFLISNLKKPRQTQAKLPELTERAVQGTRFMAQLPPEAFQPPDLLCAAALQWAGQRHRIDMLLASVGTERIRELRFDQWIGDFGAVVADASEWLGLPAPAAALRERAEEVAYRHAKVPELEFDLGRREAEADQVRRVYGVSLQRALQWAERLVLPALRQADRQTGGTRAGNV